MKNFFKISFFVVAVWLWGIALGISIERGDCDRNVQVTKNNS